MEITVYPSNAALPDHLRGQILALIRIGFHDVAGDYEGPEALPPDWHPAHVAGVEGDVLLSYAGVVWRDLEHAGEALRLYGLSSVYTFPHYRGRGLGSAIVRRATALIERAGDGDLALLFTYRALVPFYERCGWRAVAGERWLVGERARPVVHESLAMMLVLSERGRRRRTAFEQGGVYLGADPW